MQWLCCSVLQRGVHILYEYNLWILRKLYRKDGGFPLRNKWNKQWHIFTCLRCTTTMPACGICGRVPELCTYYTATHCNTLQHAATHCNALQHTHCTTRCIGCQNCAHVPLQHTATRCNTLQQAATRCNTLQHTAARCNTLIARCVGCQNCAYVTPKSNRKKRCQDLSHAEFTWGPLRRRLLGAYLQ